MAAPAAPEPAYQAPVSQGNLYYYYYPVQVIIAITITKFERCFVNQWTNAMVGYHLKPLPPQSPSIAQAEPIVEKSDDELDPLVLVLLPITILVGILALISVISKFVGRATTLLLTNCIFPFLYLYYQPPSMCPPLQMCRSRGEHYMDPLTSRVAPSQQLVRKVQHNILLQKSILNLSR